jgi:chromosome partitioning protein
MKPETKPKIITLFNHKGGVGKTTVAHNLGVSLTKQGKNVLLIDADPQMNLTSSVLGLADSVEYADKNGSKWQEAREKYTKISDYLESYITKNIRKEKLEGPILFSYDPHSQNELFENDFRGKLSLLCGDIKLFNTEALLYSIVTNRINNNTNNGTIYSIEESIRSIGSGYDFIIIDTSPSANSILNGVMIMMADYFLCPVFPNFFSLQAIDNLYEVMKNWIDLLINFRETPNNKGLSFQPKFLGIVINMAKRFEDGNGSKITVYADKWKGKLNKSINTFHGLMLDSNRTLTKKEFIDIFNYNEKQSEPFIIEQLCDFTGQIRSIAEYAGMPVVDLTNKIVKDTTTKINLDSTARKMSSFTLTKTKDSAEETHYHKAFEELTKSYNFIAKCIAEKL